jgi:adenylate cyclase
MACDPVPLTEVAGHLLQMGDVVNLASRIEQLNKQFGSQFLISETVWKAAFDSLTDALPMGAVQVKGRQAPIQIYQVA